jgi:hypothetical protein
MESMKSVYDTSVYDACLKLQQADEANHGITKEAAFEFFENIFPQACGKLNPCEVRNRSQILVFAALDVLNECIKDINTRVSNEVWLRALVQAFVAYVNAGGGEVPRVPKKWSDRFPDGRWIFYEGDDPKGFAAEIKAKFGFDPSENNPRWRRSSYLFECPVEHLDAIYGSGEYPMGS